MENLETAPPMVTGESATETSAEDLEQLYNLPAAELEVSDQAQRKELHSLSDFEELIGQPLSAEIKHKIEEIRAEKLAIIANQSERVSAYIEELAHGVASRWLAEGYIRPPSVVAEASSEILKSLEAALTEYSQTEAGMKDLEIKSLRDFLQTEQPSTGSVVAASRALGLSIGSMKFKLSSSYRQQSIGILKETANKYLDGVTESDSGFDDDLPPSQEQAKATERSQASEAIGRIVRDSTAGYTKRLIDQNQAWKYKDFEGMIDEVYSLEEQRSKAVNILKTNFTAQPPEAVLSALSRDSLTMEEVAATLEHHESKQPRSSGYGSEEDLLEAEKRLLEGLFPEPSLVGLTFGEEEKQALNVGIDKLLALSSAMGIKPFNKQKFVEKVQGNVAEMQQYFFERVESSNSLYWHFSPYGLRILHEKALMSGELSGNRLTAEHSKGVHFVKPGFGMQTEVSYSDYAQTRLTLGSRTEIPDGFGLAVIYMLGDIIEQTPLRDEPMSAKHVGKKNIAEDVTFRTDDESATYSYPVEDAYILPVLTWEQISHLRASPDFSDLIPEGHMPREALVLAITKRALELEGFTSEWIEEHLLAPDLVPLELETLGGPGGRAEVEETMYRKVSHEITSRQKRSDDLIVPLRAKKGAFEGHDTRGVRQSWKEELVKLSVA